MKLVDDKKCFACGPNNAIGLHLNFEKNAQKKSAYTKLAVSNDFCGWSGILHGGIISTILDEAMAHACFAANIPCVTGELVVRFKKPVPTEKEIEIFGQIDEVRGRLIYCSAKIMREGTVLAEGHSKMVLFESYEVKN